MRVFAVGIVVVHLRQFNGSQHVLKNTFNREESLRFDGVMRDPLILSVCWFVMEDMELHTPLCCQDGGPCERISDSHDRIFKPRHVTAVPTLTGSQPLSNQCRAIALVAFHRLATFVSAAGYGTSSG